MFTIPDTFTKRMHELYGMQGEAWSEALPSLIADCANRFGFSPETPFSNLSYNFVLRAKLSDGKPAVLKSSFLKDELSREVSVLRAYEGRGRFVYWMLTRIGGWLCWRERTLGHRCRRLRMMRWRRISFAKYFTAFIFLCQRVVYTLL